MSPTQEEGDQLIKRGGLKKHLEETCVVRKKDGVQIFLDGREVVGIIFEAGMVALDG